MGLERTSGPYPIPAPPPPAFPIASYRAPSPAGRPARWRASYDAILAGRIGLDEAKAIGRDGAPAIDAGQGQSGHGRARTGPREGRTPRPCMCSCGDTTKGGMFLPGHDARLHGELKRNLQSDPLLRNERFTAEQRAYAKERGLI